MSTWASVADVKNLTGVDLVAGVVNHAEQTIEISTGAIAAWTIGRLSRRDLYWLKLAVAHQAVWEKDQPDLLTRTDVKSFSQDGVSADLKPDALVLAPLARRALNRCSWRGTRTVGGRPAARRVYDPQGNDETLNWSPLAMP